MSPALADIRQLISLHLERRPQGIIDIALVHQQQPCACNINNNTRAERAEGYKGCWWHPPDLVDFERADDMFQHAFELLVSYSLSQPLSMSSLMYGILLFTVKEGIWRYQLLVLFFMICLIRGCCNPGSKFKALDIFFIVKWQAAQQLQPRDDTGMGCQYSCFTGHQCGCNC